MPTILLPVDVAKLPTLFRGIFWDAHWEFDAPCVIYTPYPCYGFGGNSSKFQEMVENTCIDLSLGHVLSRKWSAEVLKEFNWRGWSPRGFAKRKQAWHLEAIVKWDDSDPEEEITFATEIREQWGPFTE